MKCIILIASILRIVLIAAILIFAIYANAQRAQVKVPGAETNSSGMFEAGVPKSGKPASVLDKRIYKDGVYLNSIY